MGRPDLTLRLEIITKCIFPFFIIAAISQGIIVLCIVDFFITMVALVLNTYYSGKLLDVGYFKQIKMLLPSFLLSIAMMTVVMVVNTFIADYIIQLFVGVAVGITFYFGAAYLLKFEELVEVKYMLNRKK